MLANDWNGVQSGFWGSGNILFLDLDTGGSLYDSSWSCALTIHVLFYMEGMGGVINSVWMC